MNKYVLLLPALALGCCLPLSGQSKIRQVRTLPLLELASDARTASLGGSHYGEASSSPLYVNPTSLLYQASSLNATIGGRFFGKYEGFTGALRLQQATVGYRFSRHALHVGYRYLGGLKYEAFDAEETSRGQQSSYDYSLDLGYALRLGHFAGYATASYVRTKLGERSASTGVFGLGAYYRSHLTAPAQGLSYLVGVKAQHLGFGFKYDQTSRRTLYPPIAVGAGGELTYRLRGDHRLSLASGVDVYTFPVRSSSVAVHVGGEYSFRGLAAARLGYQHDSNGLRGWSAGLGLDLEGIRIDGAYVASESEDTNASFLITLGLSL